MDYEFDRSRLRNQITAGKGTVYNHLLCVPKHRLSNTLVITDFFCRTANYILAATLNVPVYSHQLIINCCFKVCQFFFLYAQFVKKYCGLFFVCTFFRFYFVPVFIIILNVNIYGLVRVGQKTTH